LGEVNTHFTFRGERQQAVRRTRPWRRHNRRRVGELVGT
jgi:hypothetical protein